MVLKQTLFILSIFFSLELFACQCEELNKENIEDFKQSIDYIFIGTVVDNINLEENENIDLYWEKNNHYFEVIIKVEKVIKGNLKSEFIYISQFGVGNCARNFRNSKKYIISGSKVNGFIDSTPSEEEDMFSETDSNFIKPLEIEFNNNIFYTKNLMFDYIRWNELAQRETIILTSICISGSLESNFSKLVMNEEE